MESPWSHGNTGSVVASLLGSLSHLAAQAAVAETLYRRILPRAERELARWRRLASAIPDRHLRSQALSSLTDKRFHAEGGSVYAALAPRWIEVLVPFIVALQTISDYLDNLCDRAPGAGHRRHMRCLHRAMLDAVDPGGRRGHCYCRYAARPDGGYLATLVAACQRCIRLLPSYPVVQGYVRRFVLLYNDLQVYKHLEPARREAVLRRWHARHRRRAPGLAWWEFAAAAGSTLGVFALCAAATDPALSTAEARAIAGAYFPWVSGLHILLDYFIDQAEDRAWGDLNFVAYYPTTACAVRRLTEFFREARSRVRPLRNAPFHSLVVHGLPALYLADRKVDRQRLRRSALAILAAGGPLTLLLHPICRLHLRARAGAGASGQHSL